MERLGARTQRNLIIGGLVLLAVLVLGVVGWSVYSRGQLTPQGIRIQTGLGIGGPGDTAIPPWRPPGDTGNPGHDSGCRSRGGYPFVKKDGIFCYYKAKCECECPPSKDPKNLLDSCLLDKSTGLCQCMEG